MTTDVFADVIRVSGLTSAVLGQAQFIAPWGVGVQQRAMTAHIILQGNCWLRRPGMPPLRLANGDLLLLAPNSRHVLSDRISGPVQPLASALARVPGEASGKADVTHILCATYQFETDIRHPLITGLPEMVYLPATDIARHEELMLLIQLLRAEANGDGEGRALTVPRLIDTLFVLAIRAWLSSEPALSAGWFGALQSPGIGRVLSAIHAQPERGWSIDEMASIAGQSRSTFIRRFRGRTGLAPAAYLTNWRLALAARRIRFEETTVEKVAVDTGFGSAASFSRAFKRRYGVSPTEMRNEIERE